MRWIVFIGWLGLCFGVAALGGWWTAGEVTGWYRTLAQPEFAPPEWVFGPVWTLLYALMAVAAWRISLAPPSAGRTQALGLFVAQLASNLAWSWIFFHWHAIGAALVEVIVLWTILGATVLVSRRIAPIAAWCLAPYWAWVTFAVVLNGAYWRLN